MRHLDLSKDFTTEDILFKDNKLTFKKSIAETVEIDLNRYRIPNLTVEVFEDVKVDIYERIDIDSLKTYAETVENHGYLNEQRILLGQEKSGDVISKVENYNLYTLTILDLTSNGLKGDVDIATNKEGAESYIYCASLCGNDNKLLTNKIVNYAPQTVGIMENYGVAYQKGKLEIVGIGDIKHGCYKSTNRQKSNLIVMDKEAVASSKPYLYINENDVIASHASAVGEVSSEQIFYLMARGIEYEVAKKMIVLGYFQPIINRISDDNIKDKIVDYVGRVLFNA